MDLHTWDVLVAHNLCGTVFLVCSRSGALVCCWVLRLVQFYDLMVVVIIWCDDGKLNGWWKKLQGPCGCNLNFDDGWCHCVWRWISGLLLSGLRKLASCCVSLGFVVVLSLKLRRKFVFKLTKTLQGVIWYLLRSHTIFRRLLNDNYISLFSTSFNLYNRLIGFYF